MDWMKSYKSIFVLDFEFIANDGERPTPVCMVVTNVTTNTTTKYWLDKLDKCPFPTGSEHLFVGYFASAEWGCFLQLGWEIPERIIDLYAEFRLHMNGRLAAARGNGLISACKSFGIRVMETSEKNAMRDLIVAGGPWTEQQRNSILDYCAADVEITAKLFLKMWPIFAPTKVKLGQALFRGRYTAAVARMEHAGVPMDVELHEQLLERWPLIKDRLIAEVDKDYGVYQGAVFKTSLFEAWLKTQAISWPRTANGKPKLDDATFRDLALKHPQLSALRELRKTMSQMQTLKLAVGKDGRNRTLLGPFGSKTGRNQPSTTRFIFGNAAWLRSLIKPSPGYGLAYVDYSSQEIAIAAALSGDQNMWAAYSSGDPYMAFAIQAGLAPEGATKATHKDIRNQCKQIVLGVGYGMGAEAMAGAGGIHVVQARALLQSHKMTYREFWAWAERNQLHALMQDTLRTPLGWEIKLADDPDPNERSLLNWPMQSTGADIMRLAACLLTEAGIEVCCPVHDAFLVGYSLGDQERVVRETCNLMVEASRIVLGAEYPCRVDVEAISYPDRYSDERGEAMFAQVSRLLK
ncbi:DNA polymerase [Paradonghicola geojensis]|nr:DNA polymerase [Marivivens geojensis]